MSYFAVGVDLMGSSQSGLIPARWRAVVASVKCDHMFGRGNACRRGAVSFTLNVALCARSVTRQRLLLDFV